MFSHFPRCGVFGIHDWYKEATSNVLADVVRRAAWCDERTKIGGASHAGERCEKCVVARKRKLAI